MPAICYMCSRSAGVGGFCRRAVVVGQCNLLRIILVGGARGRNSLDVFFLMGTRYGVAHRFMIIEIVYPLAGRVLLSFAHFACHNRSCHVLTTSIVVLDYSTAIKYVYSGYNYTSQCRFCELLATISIQQVLQAVSQVIGRDHRALHCQHASCVVMSPLSDYRCQS